MSYESEYVTMNNMGCKSSDYNKPVVVEGWKNEEVSERCNKVIKKCINKPNEKKCRPNDKCTFNEIKKCIKQKKCSYENDEYDVKIDSIITDAIEHICSWKGALCHYKIS